MRRRTTLLVAVVAAACAALGATAHTNARAAGTAAGSCQLANGIKHVIYLQFDNVHLRRDIPNVPSDLEQMPNLLNFLESNGTMLNKHYTILISHTAGGILSSLTGLYPDRQGVTVSNSYDYYQANGVPTFSSAFKYWTAPVAAPADNLPNMVNGDSGTPKTTPAPWVTYTRDGCDVGNASVANTVLENNNAVIASRKTTLAAAAAAGDTNIKVASVTGYTPGQTLFVDGEFVTLNAVGTAGALGTGLTITALTSAHASGATVVPVDPTGDMTTIFGQGSGEWLEGMNSQLGATPAARGLAQADFVGIAVHCADTSTSVCHNNPDARTDPLPDEPPAGYSGQALFGAKYVNPAITGGSAVVDDMNGNPIVDPFNHPGFPGFDSMPAATTLGYVAQMQESGIPVTFAYISDVHDNHAGGGAYGPGEAGYVAALKSYDDAFGKFLTRLAGDGINTSNTLFVVTADENDHYAGQPGAPSNCDGVTIPCTYNQAVGNPRHGIFDVTNGATVATDPSTWHGPTTWPPAAQNGPLVGEVGYNMKWLLGSTVNGTGYDISFDSAPSFYINNQPQAVDSNGNVVLNPTLRAFEAKAANLQVFDPYIDASKLIPAANYIVDAPTLKAIHMINADPKRTMSFTMFAKPDLFFNTSASICNSSGVGQGCVNDGFAWIHGDYHNDIGQTWLGIAGPGVAHDGLDDSTWTDHTDIVPTMNALTGLTPDYTPDGRAITQVFTPSVAKGANGVSFQQLGDVYKQLDAPYGEFAHWLIVASTNGIEADDTTYLSTERAIQSLASQRDQLVAQIRAVLNGGANGHQEQLIRGGQALIGQAKALAGA
jgi:hypothetical protein